MLEMLATMYLIVAFGVFMAGMFEGERIVVSAGFASVWPISLVVLFYLNLSR